MVGVGRHCCWEVETPSHPGHPSSQEQGILSVQAGCPEGCPQDCFYHKPPKINPECVDWLGREKPLWMGPSRVVGKRQKTQHPQGSKSRKEIWLPEAGPTHQSRDTELTRPKEIPHTASPHLWLAREANAWIYGALLFELTSGSPGTRR